MSAGMNVDVEWVYRTSQPDGVGPFPVMLLLHGWTGDEDSMWVFTPRLPTDRLFIAPRGLYQAPRGGYSWYAERHSWPQMADFQQTIEELLKLLTPARFQRGEFSELHLVGFSQGAALAIAFTLLYPERVTSLAVLSGFLPDDATLSSSLPGLLGMPVFITHGSQDTIVPVNRARQAAELFENAGAQVSYCEDDVGHKLSANCFRGLERFYRSLASE